MAAAFDLHRVLSDSFVRQIEYRDELDSTNDWALRLASGGEVVCPLLVLTDRQRSGRGRGENRWWSADGALTFSLVLEGRSLHLPVQRWSSISLVAALAVSESLAELLAGGDVRLKWPNDVYLHGRKACGILVEGSPAGRGLLVIGIGLNVNNSLSAAPGDLQSAAISLLDATGRVFDRTEVLVRILNRLAFALQQLGRDDLSLSDRWQQRCMLQGRTICLESAGRRLTGVCQGIDDEGALLVQTDAGLERCLAGTVAKIY